MENNYYQQPAAATPPVQTPAPQKPKKTGGAFGKPHILMGVSIVLTYAIIPLISGFITTAVTSLISSSSSYAYSSIFYGYTVSDIINAVVGVLKLALYIAFGYFAYKNIRGAARFLGVAFVSTSVAGVFTNIIYAVTDLITAFVLSGNPYSSDYGIASTARGIITYILMFIGAIIAAAIGVLLLMLVEKGKLNIKKKAAPAQPQQTV